MYGKKTMVYTNFLEGMFQYFRDKVIPNLLKLMNSPITTNKKNNDSLLEDKERAEAKHTPDTRKNQLIIKDTDGSITKEYVFLRHSLRFVFSITMNSWFHWNGSWYETRRGLLRGKSQEGHNNRVLVEDCK